MPDHKIELTQAELAAAIKEASDEATFRTTVTIGLKSIGKRFDAHCESSSDFRENVTKLKEHVRIQWWFLVVVVIAMVGMVFK